MKAIVATALILALALPAFAFAEDETLLGGKFSSGGFGAPVVKFTNIHDKFAVLVGGRGGWIINHQLIIGGGGYGLVQNNIDRRVVGPYESTFLTTGYGGFMMEYDLNPHKLVHGSLIMLIGGGGLNRAIEGPDYWRTVDGTGDGFFVFEPEINFTLNVTSFMRLSTGASYRFISGVELNGLSNNDLAGPAGTLALRFGKF